jgi:hypothetical protein
MCKEALNSIPSTTQNRNKSLKTEEFGRQTKEEGEVENTTYEKT